MIVRRVWIRLQEEVWRILRSLSKLSVSLLPSNHLFVLAKTSFVIYTRKSNGPSTEPRSFPRFTVFHYDRWLWISFPLSTVCYLGKIWGTVRAVLVLSVTQSRALARSQNIPPTRILLLRVRKISLVKLNKNFFCWDIFRKSKSFFCENVFWVPLISTGRISMPVDCLPVYFYRIFQTNFLLSNVLKICSEKNRALKLWRG